MRRILSKLSPSSADNDNKQIPGPDSGSTEFDNLDADDIRELYWEKGYSQNEIADQFGISVAKVSYTMRELGVEARSKRRARWDYLDGDEEMFDHLNILTPLQRQEVEAVCLGEKTAPERASERGVEPETERVVIRTALDKLEEYNTASDSDSVIGKGRSLEHPHPAEVLSRIEPGRCYVIADVAAEIEEEYDVSRGTLRDRLERLVEDRELLRRKHADGTVTYIRKTASCESGNISASEVVDE